MHTKTGGFDRLLRICAEDFGVGFKASERIAVEAARQQSKRRVRQERGIQKGGEFLRGGSRWGTENE